MEKASTTEYCVLRIVVNTFRLTLTNFLFFSQVT